MTLFTRPHCVDWLLLEALLLSLKNIDYTRRGVSENPNMTPSEPVEHLQKTSSINSAHRHPLVSPDKVLDPLCSISPRCASPTTRLMVGTGGNTDERPRIAKVEQLRSPLLRAKGCDLLLPSCRRMLLKTLADDIVTRGSRLNRKTLPAGLALTEPGRLHSDHASHGITSWFVACMGTRNSMWHSVQVGTSGSIQFGSVIC